jgi:cytochrome c-type biogenesis protein CcsB
VAETDVLLFWVALGAYLVSTIVYTLFFAFQKPTFLWTARGGMALGFVAHTIAILGRAVQVGHMPVTNLYEYVSLFAWAVVLGYWVIVWKVRKPLLGPFVAPVAFTMIVVASLFPKDANQQLVPALQSYWLQIHVTLAVLGEGAFAVAFAASVTYLMKSARPGGIALAGSVTSLLLAGIFLALWNKLAPLAVLRGGAVLPFVLGTVLLSIPFFGAQVALANGIRKKLPDLDQLDEIAYRGIAIGYPLFFIGALLAGAVWAHHAWGKIWGWDPKEVGALVVFLIYSAYLHARSSHGWRGQRAAVLSVLGFAAAIFTLFGNLVLGGLHAYN